MSKSYPAIARYTLPLILVCALTLLFIFSAQRGFDLSDEGYYLVKFQYGNTLKMAARGFYIYLSIPFKMLGENIFIFRVFAYILLLFAGYFFGKAWLRLLSKLSSVELSDIRYPSLIIAITAIFYYAPYTTLMTPSYNWLNLMCQVLSTGLLFTFLVESSNRWQAIVYGFILSIALVNKFSSGINLILIHLCLIGIFYSLAFKNSLQKSIPYMLVGFIANIFIIKLSIPDVFDKFNYGLHYILISSPRSVFKELWSLVTEQFPPEILKALDSLGFGLGFIMLLTLAIRKVVPEKVSILILLGVFFVLATMSLDSFFQPRIFSFVLLGIFLWAIWAKTCPPQRTIPINKQIGLYLVFMLFPILYSLGTLLQVLSHANMAMIFPCAFSVGILSLLFANQVISEKSFKASLSCFAIPLFVLLAKPWFNVEDTYRLNTSLSEQVTAFPIANNTNILKIDHKLAHSLHDFKTLLTQAHFHPTTPMLDLTGASAGLVYVANARPIGNAWFVGAYTDSDGGARYILNLLDKQEIQNAWLLTSDDHERRLDAKGLLTPILGGVPYEYVGSVSFKPIDYFNHVAQTGDIHIQVWKPKNNPPLNALE